jgi:glycosyltransferase involved in cell wall biosynthesis
LFLNSKSDKNLEVKDMKIAQMHLGIYHGDAISNVMLTNDEIFKEKGWESYLIVELFSDVNKENVLVRASKDYIKEEQLLKQLFSLFSRFLRKPNKMHYFKKYVGSLPKYKPGKAKEIIESADIRIWHFGVYNLFRYLHERDIIWYHGITYPYLASHFEDCEFRINAKILLQAMLDMKPTFIAVSNFVKENLIDLGAKESRIRVLPLFHKLKIQRHKLNNKKDPKLLTWGRYASNKQVVQIAKFCYEHNISFTAFGDNVHLKEYYENYKEAKKYENEKIHILPKQKDFLPFVQEHDIFISNSRWESFLVPAIEAASQGLPLLIRKGTAPDDFFKHKGIKPGFLFKDLEEIPSLIEEIVKDYDYYSEQANKLAKLYTFDIYKKKLLKILEEYKREIDQ